MSVAGYIKYNYVRPFTRLKTPDLPSKSQGVGGVYSSSGDGLCRRQPHLKASKRYYHLHTHGRTRAGVKVRPQGYRQTSLYHSSCLCLILLSQKKRNPRQEHAHHLASGQGLNTVLTDMVEVIHRDSAQFGGQKRTPKVLELACVDFYTEAEVFCPRQYPS